MAFVEGNHNDIGERLSGRLLGNPPVMFCDFSVNADFLPKPCFAKLAGVFPVSCIKL